MVDKDQKSGSNILSFKTPERRFPKAAITYVDTLLSVQRERFERELQTREKSKCISIDRPDSLHILAESDEFIGAGWSSIGRRRDGTSFRWMDRIGSILLPIDLSKPRSISVKGCGFTKRRFLKETTLWVEDTQVPFSLSRRGFNRWTFSGEVPAMPERPFYLLRLQSPGTAQLAEGIDARVSLAVSEIRINC